MKVVPSRYKAPVPGGVVGQGVVMHSLESTVHVTMQSAQRLIQ